MEERPRIEGDLPTVLDKARTEVDGLLRKPSRLMGTRFREMPEYPDFAWREAMHNAVAHRDYAIQGAGTEIWMFEDRMEVVSAGAFPEGVTLEQVLRLERIHRSRNPRIVRALVDLGYAKDQGEGIPRMFAEMEDAFLPRPDVEVQGQQVMVTLRNTSTLTASDRRFVAGLGDAELSRGEFRALLMAYRRDRGHGKTPPHRGWTTPGCGPSWDWTRWTPASCCEDCGTGICSRCTRMERPVTTNAFTVPH